MKRTVEEINNKIKNKKAIIFRADEMTKLVKEQGYKKAFEKVDIVTTGTFGAGSKIFIGGDIGMIVGSGTQHNPKDNFATLMVTGDLKKMSDKFLRSAYMDGYGSTLYIGIGLPIKII